MYGRSRVGPGPETHGWGDCSGLLEVGEAGKKGWWPWWVGPKEIFLLRGRGRKLRLIEKA
jgi:hypothetical protein